MTKDIDFTYVGSREHQSFNALITYYITLQYSMFFFSKTGDLQKFNRRTIKGFEEVTHKIRQLQAKGKMVTQAVYIVNMDNFNLAQQGCLQCMLRSKIRVI